MAEGCEKTPPRAFHEALELFNAGKFFSCHEFLEAIWLAEPTPVRDVYKGCLQAAVALHHEKTGNRKGALRLLGRSLELLGPFAPVCLGLDIAALVKDLERIREKLKQRTDLGERLERWELPVVSVVS